MINTSDDVTIIDSQLENTSLRDIERMAMKTLKMLVSERLLKKVMSTKSMKKRFRMECLTDIRLVNINC